MCSKSFKLLTPVFALLLSLFLICQIAYSWSNGGYSESQSNPDYGTHDWIAEHALDWLPQEEKQFILDNIAVYLYGTELPDNNEAPDGIGDTGNHHVYYFANCSLQNDAAAVRAQEEYALAVELYRNGNFSGAAKRLGVMAHYIADVAVFAHVMGAKTDWGSENTTVHGDYESYVNTRTNNYADKFDIFLKFDGNLSYVSAYNATLMLAYDTTFDVDGNLTCVWMNKNYNWSDPTFKNRCGESLNLAVNLIADVLHTFYTEAIIPEFPAHLILPLFMILTLIAILYLKKDKSNMDSYSCRYQISLNIF
ncbi:MAG: zinc dependent phospholipase C family protein [Candidatus Bathyarchaeia archaeon]